METKTTVQQRHEDQLREWTVSEMQILKARRHMWQRPEKIRYENLELILSLFCLPVQ